MKIINIPIEPLEERYSIQWDKWFKEQFAENKLNVQTVYGTKTKGKIIHGSFLDVLETNLYKTSQLQKIIKILHEYDNKEPLVLFFHDLWFPGLANIAYIRDGMHLKNLYICGCLHAGSYDPYDFLNKQQMTPWAHLLEESMFEIVDMIFVATYFHAEMLHKRRKVPNSIIHVTGFPLYPDFVQQTTKEGIILFPHRLDSEKQPDLFDALKQMSFPYSLHWTWIKTKDVAKTKEEYYTLLNKSRFAISFALQETWGIAMQEAVLCGCFPIVPRRLSYPELYIDPFLYDSVGEILSMIDKFWNDPPLEELRLQQKSILNNGAKAIPHIINLIKTLQ